MVDTLGPAMDDRERRRMELDDLADLIPREIALALPEGWAFERANDKEWRVFRHGYRKENSYSIFLVEHFFERPDDHLQAGAIVITHENTDAGPITLAQVLKSATVIGLSIHTWYPLSECLAEVFATRRPNDYGLT